MRESSLLAFLTQMTGSLRNARPRELREVYGGVGGSASAHGGGGAGDMASSSDATRNMLEGKLSNRSLVLFGGGVHGNNAKPSPPSAALVGPVGTTTTMHIVASTAASGKRQRNRVGGNGTFGSISNKRRKMLSSRRFGRPVN